MTEIVKITIRRDYPAGQVAIAPQPNPFTPAPKLVAVGGGEGGGSGGGLTDGDKGDIIVSGGGTALNIDPAVLTTSGRALTSAATVAAQRGALGLGTAAVASTTAFDASGTAAAALATHVSEGDPHPGYLTEAAATVALAGKADLVGGVVPTSQIPALAITAYLGAVASDAAMLALVGERGDWCNRSDNPKGSFILIADDPTLIGSWQRLETPGAPVTSVNAQAGVIVLGPADVGATPAGHAGTGGSEHPGAIAGGAAGFMSGADKTKLDGVATGATANASDAALIARGNHTGTQSAATISDFTEAAQDVVGAMVAAAGGSYDDGAGGITLPPASVAASLLADGAAAAPATPTGDDLALFASLVGGLAMPTALDSTGKAYVLQPAMFDRPMRSMQPGSAGTPAQIGPPLTLTGTVTHPVLAATNYKTAHARTMIATTAVAGNTAGFRNAQTGEAYRRYGFLFHCAMAIQTLVAGQRGAVGVADTAVALSNIDPLASTTPGRIVLGYNGGGGNMWIAHCITGTAPTVIDLGANFPVNTSELYDFFIGCAPSGNPVWFVGRFDADGGYSHTATDEITANMPALTTNLLRWGFVTNNATASICAMEVGQVSIWPIQ